MSIKHLIFTEPHFISPRWQHAMPDAVCITSADTAPSASQRQLVWVLTGLPDWLQLISHYQQLGKKVIAMTRHGNIAELREALNAGATGYIDALASQQQLEQAATTVLADALWLPSTLLSSLIGVLSSALPQPKAAPDILAILTHREREVTSVVLTGVSNKEVARQLNITERTVKEHLSSVFSKLGVSDRLQLMLKARS